MRATLGEWASAQKLPIGAAVTTTFAKPKVSPIPEGLHSLTASFTVHDAAAAIDFYQRAFGAVEINRAMAPDGQKIWHAMLQIGDSRLMLNDEFPDMDGSQS